MEKNIIKRFIKLRIKPVNAVFEDQGIGPILSPFLTRDKINIFCSEFNNISKSYINEFKLSVIFFINLDNSFFFVIKGPRLSELLKIILNTEVSARPMKKLPTLPASPTPMNL